MQGVPAQDRQVVSLPLSVFDALLGLFLFLENVFSGIDVMTGGKAWRDRLQNLCKKSNIGHRKWIPDTEEENINSKGVIPYYSFPFSEPKDVQRAGGISFPDIKAQLAADAQTSSGKSAKSKFLSAVDAALDATFWSSFRLSGKERTYRLLRTLK